MVASDAAHGLPKGAICRPRGGALVQHAFGPPMDVGPRIGNPVQIYEPPHSASNLRYYWKDTAGKPSAAGSGRPLGLPPPAAHRRPSHLITLLSADSVALLHAD